jgi:hypothetical protein
MSNALVLSQLPMPLIIGAGDSPIHRGEERASSFRFATFVFLGYKMFANRS